MRKLLAMMALCTAFMLVTGTWAFAATSPTLQELDVEALPTRALRGIGTVDSIRVYKDGGCTMLITLHPYLTNSSTEVSSRKLRFRAVAHRAHLIQALLHAYLDGEVHLKVVIPYSWKPDISTKLCKAEVVVVGFPERKWE